MDICQLGMNSVGHKQRVPSALLGTIGRCLTTKIHIKQMTVRTPKDTIILELWDTFEEIKFQGQM